MMKRFAALTLFALVLIGLLASSCRARDCKGRKKTAKTAMGGWL
jgi:hypothetical protein